MPTFDRIDGTFVATCTFEERFIFRRQGWEWNAKRKRWVTADVENARALDVYAVGQAREHLDAVEKVREHAVAASWAEDTAFLPPCPDGLNYLDFQRAGIEFAIQRRRTLIADPPGLGKTVQAIGVSNVERPRKVLIVVPASLKINWQREWWRWDVHDMTVDIAASKTRTRSEKGRVVERWTEYRWPDTNVVIINYDMLDKFDDQIKETAWDLLICDEAHLLKTATTIRTKCVFGGRLKQIKKNGKVTRRAKTFAPIRAKRSLFLTGTPILSQPSELWTLVHACDRNGLGTDWDEYVNRYCDAYPSDFGLDVSGSSNMDELNRLLRERFMVRRDKKAVLKDLPDKLREMILLPQDKLEKPIKKERTRVEQAMRDFEELLGISGDVPEFRFITMIDELSERIGAALDDQDGEEPDWDKAVKSLSEPDQILFTEIAEAREEVALAKVGMVVDHVMKLREAGEPVILFAHHKSVVEALVERLKALGQAVGMVTGKVPVNKRQGIVDSFQNGEIDIIIGNTLAMGVGFTLTRARHVVFAELDWVPALIEQAEDRAWRHGQVNAVLIQHLVVDGSIEARMAESLLAKMGVIFEALDAKLAA